MPQYPTCDHIKANGNTCESPAIKDSPYCYFHSRDRQRLRNLQQARDLKNHRCKGHFTDDDFSAEILESLDLPLLEDAAAIQVALSGVVRAIAGHHIAERRAALLLYGLRRAPLGMTNSEGGYPRLTLWAHANAAPAGLGSRGAFPGSVAANWAG